MNALFTDGKPPSDIDERNKQIDNWDGEHEELLEQIDATFWDRSEMLEQALLEHIKKTGIG